MKPPPPKALIQNVDTLSRCNVVWNCASATPPLSRSLPYSAPLFHDSKIRVLDARKRGVSQNLNEWIGTSKHILPFLLNAHWSSPISRKVVLPTISYGIQGFLNNVTEWPLVKVGWQLSFSGRIEVQRFMTLPCTKTTKREGSRWSIRSSALCNIVPMLSPLRYETTWTWRMRENSRKESLPQKSHRHYWYASLVIVPRRKGTDTAWCPLTHILEVPLPGAAIGSLPYDVLGSDL